jgi:hypothetical protein
VLQVGIDQDAGDAIEEFADWLDFGDNLLLRRGA